MIGRSLRQWQKFESGEVPTPKAVEVLIVYLQLVDQLRKEQASLRRLVEAMLSGQHATRGAQDGKIVDTTADSLEEARIRLAELDQVIAEALQLVGLDGDVDPPAA
tara:strand:- start:44 stop:361 length:318 start_codon:yes stop_codon:yes gene_type:complete